MMAYCCPSCTEKERSALRMGEPPIEYLEAKVLLLHKLSISQIEKGEVSEAIKNIDRLVKTLHRIGIKNER